MQSPRRGGEEDRTAKRPPQREAADQAHIERKEKEEIFSKYEILKNAPTKVDVVENPETLEKLKSVSDELREKDAEILKLKKSLDLNNKLTVFKVKFEELQIHLSNLEKLMLDMAEEDKSKCHKALKAVMGAYL